MTPQEMADWLEQRAHEEERPDGLLVPGGRALIFRDIANHLRRQPTDAQKIEALQAERLAVMCRMGGATADEFHHHREALRLLGLSTE